MKKVIAAIATAVVALSLAGCGGTSSALSIGTIEEGAQNLAKAMESGDPSKMKELTSADTVGKGRLLDVKPTKAASDVKVGAIKGSTVTMSYKIGSTKFTDDVKFILHVDDKGNAAYIPEEPPYVWTSYAGLTLNGTKLNNKNGSKVYFMPGEYQMSYEDNLVEYSGATDLGVNEEIDFGSLNRIDNNEPSRDGNFHLFEEGKASKKYVETMKQALADSAAYYTCEDQFDTFYSTADSSTIDELVNDCKTVAGGNERIDTSNVTVTIGKNLADATFGGTARVTVCQGLLSCSYKNEDIDINEFRPRLDFSNPWEAKGASSTVDIYLDNSYSVLLE